MKTRTIFALWLLITVLKLNAQEATPYNIGTFRYLEEPPADCPPGYTCSSFEVKCEGSANARGVIAYAAQRGDQPRGLLMLFKGGRRTAYWTQPFEANQMAEEFRKEGFGIVQLKWVDSRLLSSPGLDAGIAHLAARPATVIRQVYEDFFLPLEKKADPQNFDGFCLTGNSGGASALRGVHQRFGAFISASGRSSALRGVRPSRERRKISFY